MCDCHRCSATLEYMKLHKGHILLKARDIGLYEIFLKYDDKITSSGLAVTGATAPLEYQEYLAD